MEGEGDSIKAASAASNKKDAWSVLMQSAKVWNDRASTSAKKRQRGGTAPGSFVECPAGCGKHVPGSIINVHLDRCPVLLRRQEPDDSLTGSMQVQNPDPVVPNDNEALDQDAVQPPNQSLPSTDSVGGPCQEEATERSQRERVEGSCARSPPRRVSQDATSAGSDEKAINQQTPEGEARRLPPADDLSSSHHESPMSESCIGSTSIPRDPASALPSNAMMPTASADEKVPGTLGLESEMNLPSAPTTASSPCLEARETKLPPNTLKASGASNAFSIMMERSKALNSKWHGSSKDAAAVAAEAHPIQQCLYLSKDSLRVTLFEGAAKPPPPLPVAWSAVVVLKDRAVEVATTDAPPNGAPSAPVSRLTRRPVELTIATDVPSAADATVAMPPGPSVSSTRYVRHHSRLSVPVLKSVLQKSVRRRRPLPSVRVAMELADKSFGDLIRRLPVIALEDSMLHPDVDLLIWLMVAHSKDYAIPRAVMTRVFQIVFEVASCQWRDDEKAVAHDAASTTSFESTSDLCLNTLHSMGGVEPPTVTAPALRRSNQLVWSLLVRAEYGGMRCDVEMLHRHARQWQARFRSPGVPPELVKRWGLVVQPAERPLSWRNVPSLLHERAAQQCADRVHPLVAQGIPSLAFEDIAVEGVDFHCSPIVDHLLSHPIAKLCSDLLVLAGTHETPERPGPPSSGDDVTAPTISLEGFFRHCLWHYSSGVNRRQPLLAGPERRDPTQARRPEFEEMWRQLVAKEASHYQGSFVRDRMARNGHG